MHRPIKTLNREYLNEPEENDSSQDIEFKKNFFGKKKYIRGIVGIFITLALLWFLVPHAKPKLFILLARNAQPNMLAWASLIYAATFILRSHRFHLMFGERDIRYQGLFAVVSLHSFFNHVLPFRAGELSYIHLQKRYHKIPYSEGSASLILARLYDILALFFLGVMLLLPFFLPQTDQPIGFILWIVFVLMVFFLLLFFLKRFSIFASVNNFLHHLLSFPHKSPGLGGKIMRFSQKVLAHSSDMIKDAHFSRLLSISMAIWLLTFLYFFIIFRALGQGLCFMESLLPAYGAIVGNLLPVNGLGSIGTFETGLTFGQISIGKGSYISVPIAFMVHAHVILVGLILSGFSWAYLHFRLKSGVHLKSKQNFFSKH